MCGVLLNKLSENGSSPKRMLKEKLTFDDNDDDDDDDDDAANICCLAVASAQYVNAFCTAY